MLPVSVIGLQSNPMFKLALLTLAVAAFAFSVADARGYGASTQAEIQVMQLINAARAQGTRCAGGGGGVRLGPLSYNPTLRVTALAHASNMRGYNFISHYWRGVGPRTRVARAGYKYLRMSEIIYMYSGRGRPADAVRWWLLSPVHCRAIMNRYYTSFGAGYGGGGAWDVILAQPN
jgi:uncharacterized protein YkwD